MNVLLTGGAGYVGSACLRWLLQHGYNAFAYDNMFEGNEGAVPEDRLIVGDILDTDRFTRALEDRHIEAVMHFAALASVPESIDDPDSYWRVNVVGTKSVLDAMCRVGIKRLLFSSTAATFSFDEPMPLVETSQQIPQVPYGTTKLVAEYLIKDYSNAYGIGATMLRYFNASGADPDGEFGEDRNHETHLIPLILSAATGKRDAVKVFGTDWPTRDGSCVRDYVHTSDLAQAHQLALEHLTDGKVDSYNVGSGDGTTVLEVLHACEQAVGKSIPHVRVGRRAGDPAILIASPAKLESIGWIPAYADIRRIVDTAWRWHTSHPAGYK